MQSRTLFAGMQITPDQILSRSKVYFLLESVSFAEIISEQVEILDLIEEKSLLILIFDFAMICCDIARPIARAIARAIAGYCMMQP